MLSMKHQDYSSNFSTMSLAESVPPCSREKSSAFTPFNMNSVSEKMIFPVSTACPQISSHPSFLPYPTFVSPAPAYLQRYCSHDFGMLPLREAKGMIAHMSNPYLPHGSFPMLGFHHTEEEKPSQSYIGLIGKAILSTPQKKLVLSDIYNYILTNYPYFRNKGPGWRNSIRHNLSLNECFIKVGRSPNGKGHFWAINPANYDDFSRGEYRRKRANKKKATIDTLKGKNEREIEIVPKLETNVLPSASIALPTFSLPLASQTARSNGNKQHKGFHIETLLSTTTSSVSKSTNISQRTDF